MTFHQVTITRKCNGAIVKVGCQEFVFEKKNFTKMLKWVEDYLLEPSLTMGKAAKDIEYGKVEQEPPFNANQPATIGSFPYGNLRPAPMPDTIIGGIGTINDQA